jgi:hypothetical protein
LRVLITGKGGGTGSWQIRGEQLGRAIGAEVFPQAEASEIRAADLVVAVKRTPERLIRALRAGGRPWVLDFVDGWPQPEGNEWPEKGAKRWLRDRLAILQPSAVVFPTTRMLGDSGWKGPALVLPHHAWPKYERQPVAATVSRVGYEGAPDYLGKWRGVLERACAARGWEFVVNGDLSSCQIGVALRDVGGYPAGAWKANTKLANCQALGLPALITPEEGYREFGSGAQTEILHAEHVGPVLDMLSDPGIRRNLGEQAYAATPRLADVAATYREWLCGLKF